MSKAPAKMSSEELLTAVLGKLNSFGLTKSDGKGAAVTVLVTRENVLEVLDVVHQTQVAWAQKLAAARQLRKPIMAAAAMITNLFED